jgi:glycosyltransferase involved in cell wall biosynthesis
VKGWGFSSWRTIIGYLKEKRPQILHIQYQAAAYGMHPAINLLPGLLRLRSPQPGLLVTFHDLKVPYLFPKAGPLRLWAILALAKGCDQAIVTNGQDEEEARNHGLRPLLIPIGSNIKPEPPQGYNREEWRRRLGVSQGEILLSYFGFLHQSKGAESLLRALKALRQRGGQFRLLMVGGKVGASDPTVIEYARRMERLIEELGLGDHIFWTGYLEPPLISAHLLASDICVLPYRDGASLRRGTLMAALAHGLPIVSTHPRSEVRELVEGQNIALVPPDDVGALAAKIEQLASSEEARYRLGQGAKRLSEAFSWERIAKETAEVYEAVARAA